MWREESDNTSKTSILEMKRLTKNLQINEPADSEPKGEPIELKGSIYKGYSQSNTCRQQLLDAVDTGTVWGSNT